jgi:hypothetical protein
VVARLVCPYCYESFPEREIGFRCTGRTSRTGTSCPRRPDEVLLRQTGRREALPPFFEADGRRTSASCPACQDETTYRVCPVCHSQLPLHFGKVPSRMIAMIGARESGKTVYLTVLVHELMHRVGARFDLHVSGSDEQTRARFGAQLESALYARGQLLGATRSAATATANRAAPLVFRFSVQRLGRFGRTSTSASLLSFFDTAGEDLTSQASVDVNARYLASADGIILLVDPLQLPGSRRLATTGRLPAPAPAMASPLNVLLRVTELLQAHDAGRPSARVAKPLAVAFSKLDTLWPTLPDDSVLQRPAPDSSRFDEADSQEVHEHVRALLDDWGGAQMDQHLQHHYRRHRYFALSALGEDPTPNNRVSARGIRPYRVADPFLWLLTVFGAIPKDGG